MLNIVRSWFQSQKLKTFKEKKSVKMELTRCRIGIEYREKKGSMGWTVLRLSVASSWHFRHLEPCSSELC